MKTRALLAALRLVLGAAAALPASGQQTAGRPVLIKGKTQVLFGGMGRLSENCVLNIKNKSHFVTAEIVVPKEGAEGVIKAAFGRQ